MKWGVRMEDRRSEYNEKNTVEDLMAWAKARYQGMSFDEFKESLLDNKSKEKNNQSEEHRKVGRQEVLSNSRGKEAVRRTYIMEVENLQKMEEIKVFLYRNQYIQLSQVINDAVKFYYDYLIKTNSQK